MRQKPAFARAWWRELLADGLASAAGFTLTATSVTVEETQAVRSSSSPSSAAHLEASSTLGLASDSWYQRFLRVAVSQQCTSLTVEDLCEDVSDGRTLIVVRILAHLILFIHYK